jgi:hypothetical protein
MIVDIIGNVDDFKSRPTDATDGYLLLIRARSLS